MKGRALLTVGLYIVSLSVLCVPSLLFLSGDFFSFLDSMYLLCIWIIPILVISQAALLLVPVAIVHERPIKRRRIKASAIMGAIPMTILSVFFITSIILMILGEDSSSRIARIATVANLNHTCHIVGSMGDYFL